MNELCQQWCDLDTSAKELTKQLKEIKQSKEDISSAIINEMKRTNTESIVLGSGGKLVYKVSTIRSGLNSESIEETLKDFFKLPHTHDINALATETTEAIMNGREASEKHILRRIKK